MPPRLIPENPTFTTASERDVWDRLREQLGPDDVLLANMRLTNSEKDHEADLIVLIPDVGVVVLEIKGGSVWHDKSGWWIKRNGKDKRIDPVEQVRKTKYAFKGYVEGHHRWGRGGRAWAHGVVTPYATFGADFSVPELPRWALHDSDDQATLGERVRAQARKMHHERPAPSYDDVELIVDILTGPTQAYDVNAEARAQEAEADRLTQEQATLLGVTRLLNRVEVRGGAGSGKTVLALQQVKELSRGRHERKAQRVALICYSIGLAQYLRHTVQGWHRKERPKFVGTFEEFGRQWGAPTGTREDSAFWEEELPAIMSDLAAELPLKERYDSIVVDEAQDFAESWWRPVLGALRDEQEGGLYVYSDENQRIFGRFGRPPVTLVPLVLDHNLRNTKQIHASFAPLAPSRMYARGGSGPDVRFVPASCDDALAVADHQVARLLEEGWRPGHVCLLTTGHRHPQQMERTPDNDQVAYWQRWWDDEVFYGHVLGCKGLERPAVVLCLNERQVRDRARERLYVGMSRATHELVVVGDPAYVREVGGHQVAKSLGL